MLEGLIVGFQNLGSGAFHPGTPGAGQIVLNLSYYRVTSGKNERKNLMRTFALVKPIHMEILTVTSSSHSSSCFPLPAWTPGWDKNFHFVSAQFSEQKFRLKQRDSKPFIGEIIIHQYIS